VLGSLGFSASGLRRLLLATVVASAAMLGMTGAASADELPMPDGGHLDVKIGGDREWSTATRYFADGSLDLAYGDCGTTKFGGPVAPSPGIPDPRYALNDAQVDAAGNLYASGIYKWSSSIHSWQGTVVKLTPDGAFDLRFGGDGSIITPLPPKFSYMLFYPHMKVLPDGHIVLIGTIWIEEPPYLPIAEELNPDGTFDTSFGDDGYELIDLNPSVYRTINYLDGFTVDDDGAITMVVSNAALTGEQTFHFQADTAPYAQADPVPHTPADCQPPAAEPDAPAVVATAVPFLKLSGIRSRLHARAFRALAGTATGAARVEVAVTPSGAKPVWRIASGASTWSYKLKRTLKAGRYVVRARGVASDGRVVAQTSRLVRLLG
jgi:hypothetical protein